MKSNQNKRSRDLAYLLRHDKSYRSFEVGGWRQISSLNFTIEELKEIVTNDEKGRFEIHSDKIRCLYGHSVDIDMAYIPKEPPAVLYHGTSEKAATSILEEGLVARSRNFVHLTSDQRSAFDTGTRHGKPAWIAIDSHRMVEEGYQFFNPIGNVWLSKFIPAKYIWSVSKQETKVQADEGKFIKLFCLSGAIAEVIKEDSFIDEQCEVLFKPSDFRTIGDWANNNQLCIFLVDSSTDRKLIERIIRHQNLTRGMLFLSPISIEGVPYIRFQDKEDVRNILQSIIHLVLGGYPVPVDYNDVYTSLLETSGEIKLYKGSINADSTKSMIWSEIIENFPVDMQQFSNEW